MNDLYWETISPEMRQIMAGFSTSEVGAHFYLAGGTALALQLGHRKSFDLDFFSPDQDIPTIREALFSSLQPFEPVLAESSWGNLVFLMQGVRVGFYGYGYRMAAEFRMADDTRLASIQDIGLMKLDALLARASRKDFFDIYEICQQISLRALLDLAPQKYPSTRDFEAMVVRRLVYFERADMEEPLPMLKLVTWQQVKAFFREQAIQLGRGWLECS